MTYYKKYAVYYEFVNGKEVCILFHPTSTTLKHDGDNYVCRGGSEEMFLYIYDDLEEALLKANYNPKYIKILLNNKSLRKLEQILQKYKWDKKLGLIHVKRDAKIL